MGGRWYSVIGGLDHRRIPLLTENADFDFDSDFDPDKKGSSYGIEPLNVATKSPEKPLL